MPPTPSPPDRPDSWFRSWFLIPLALVVAFGVAAFVYVSEDSAPAEYEAKPLGTFVGDERPNVVMIMADDQTVGSVYAMPKMLSEFDDEGTRFRQSLVSNALC